MNVITKLALRRITAKKARSGVICAAVLLTTVLFMTVVSIAVNLLSAYSLMLRMAAGTDYHGYLRGTAFTLSGEELRDAVRQSNDIAEAVISSNVTQYAMTEEGVTFSCDPIRAVEKAEDLQHFYTDVTEGRFPENDTEILVNPLYFPDAKPGDTVGLYYIRYTGDTPGTAYAEFTVSGLMKSRTDAQLRVVMRYSGTLAEAYGFSEHGLNVYFRFRNEMNLTGKYDAVTCETLAAYRQPEVQAFGGLNTAYLEASPAKALNPANIFLILFSAAVVFLCSFLLIYNVYSIALVQDMQAFGLLNVIGTTYKQMRRMIIIQSLILFAAALPAGLTAGYFIGWKLLSPLLFSVLAHEGLRFQFSLRIPLITVLLTGFTLLWSATRPLNKLKSLTPIGAVEYSPAADLPKRYVRRKNTTRRNVTPDTRKLARYTVSRNKKKTVITALSMSLSVILFMLIAALCDYLIAYTEAGMQFSDYLVSLDRTCRYVGGTEEFTVGAYADAGVGIGEDFVTAAERSVYTDKVWRIRTAMTELRTPEAAKEELAVLRNAYPYYDNYPILGRMLSGRMDTLVVSIPDELFERILIDDGHALGKGYETGYAVYDGSNAGGITDSQGNPCSFSHFRGGDTVGLGNGSYRIVTSHVLGPTADITGWISKDLYRAVLYLPESAFLTEFGEGQTAILLVNAKEDCYELLRPELEKQNDSFSVSVEEAVQARALAEAEEAGTSAVETLSYSAGIDGRMDGLDQMKQTVLAIETVGYSFAAMIFLIGALNVVNTALSSAAERKREFAVLEAVGMTERQMRRMLLTESLYSGGAAVLITVCVGFPLLAVIISTAMDALVSVNWLSGVLMLTVCIAVSVFAGLTMFRLTKSASVVERIDGE